MIESAALDTHFYQHAYPFSVSVDQGSLTSTLLTFGGEQFVVVGGCLVHCKMLSSICSPGWCGSVDCALVCELQGRWFDSQSGHMPGFRARCPVGGMLEATIY